MLHPLAARYTIPRWLVRTRKPSLNLCSRTTSLMGRCQAKATATLRSSSAAFGCLTSGRVKPDRSEPTEGDQRLRDRPRPGMSIG
jgi:hypothetical protein